MTTRAPMCADCRHRHKGYTTCRAYPDGIPEVILLSLVDHRYPYNGDGGIQFDWQPDIDNATMELLENQFDQIPERENPEEYLRQLRANGVSL